MDFGHYGLWRFPGFTQDGGDSVHGNAEGDDQHDKRYAPLEREEGGTKQTQKQGDLMEPGPGGIAENDDEQAGGETDTSPKRRLGVSENGLKDS